VAKLTADSLTTMLLRKADWHDDEGIKYLLEHGADPNRMNRFRLTALHQSLRRDNGRIIIELLMDHGADPTLRDGRDGRSAVEIAARRGRRDALELFEARGIPIELQGALQLIAACARGDSAAVRSISASEPEHVKELLADGGALLAEFAGNNNSGGLKQLLDLGVPIAALYQEGDIYFDIAPHSTALHVAAWRAQHDALRFLIERGAPINTLDVKGRTPLALAVRACVDSYWAYRRSPESVEALLRAGASVAGVAFPSGYAEVDRLLESYGAAGK
jgi:ankyrin repeat protein